MCCDVRELLLFGTPVSSSSTEAAAFGSGPGSQVFFENPMMDRGLQRPKDPRTLASAGRTLTSRCACVRVCAWVRVCACVCACVRV